MKFIPEFQKHKALGIGLNIAIDTESISVMGIFIIFSFALTLQWSQDDK